MPSFEREGWRILKRRKEGSEWGLRERRHRGERRRQQVISAPSPIDDLKRVRGWGSERERLKRRQIRRERDCSTGGKGIVRQ